MEEKKYQVFISSTYRDLVGARDKVIETILGLYHFPIGMEMFSADDDEQWDVIKETINDSDYYVLIIGHRYGTETLEGIGYTEKEYDYAVTQNVPILAFVRERDVATKPEERDDDPKKTKKLANFLKKATEGKMCDFWKNEDELAKKVAIALPKYFRRNPRVGWVRSDKAMSPDVSNEFARLSRENNELRRELEILNTKISNKKPIIDIQLNDNQSLHLEFKQINIGRLKELPYPTKFTENIVPSHLKSYISNSDISSYNELLPDNKLIDDYNKKLRSFYRIKQSSEQVVISINNVGSVKAHDVLIDITFPEEIVLIHAEKADSLSPPKNPMPFSLIAKAEEAYKKEQENKYKPFQHLTNHDLFNMSQITPVSRHFDHLINSIKKNNAPHISISENNIHIKLESLLHTRSIEFDEYKIVPVKPGNYEIIVSIICEEYDEEQVITIPVAVVDDIAVSKEADNYEVT